MLLAVPIIGAAILVAVLLGADLADLLQGSLRDIFTTIASTLMSEPVALVAFIIAFSLSLFGGSLLMFVVKGGTVEVMLAANEAAGAIEREPLTYDSVRSAARFTLQRFMGGCATPVSTVCRPRHHADGRVRRVDSGYAAFVVYGYRADGVTQSSGAGRWSPRWRCDARRVDHRRQFSVPADAGRDGG